MRAEALSLTACCMMGRSMTLTQKPVDPWARSPWVEEWVFAVVMVKTS